MQLLQYTATLRELKCPLPPGNAAVHCTGSNVPYPRAVRQHIAADPLPTAPRHRGNALQDFHNPCPKARHYLTAWGLWAVELLQCTASLPGGSAQWNSCNALFHCLGAVGSGKPAMHCVTAWGQWPLWLLPYSAKLLGGSGQWAMELLSRTASFPGVTG